MAYRDPLKFYDNVMKQDIVEHKISQKRLGKQPLKYNVLTTRRAIAIFLEAIDEKLSALMKRKTKHILEDEYDDEEVEAALNDEQMKLEVEKHISQGSIKLVHKDSGEQVFV